MGVNDYFCIFGGLGYTCPMKKILISACLLGEPVRYDGASRPLSHSGLNRLKEKARLIPFCPEVAGGLSTPRPPAEICDHRVRTREGDDVTPCFENGARLALEVVMEEGITLALLKEKSPSCGVLRIYDGSFSGTLIPGRGLTSQALAQAGLSLYSEENLDALLEWVFGSSSP